MFSYFRSDMDLELGQAVYTPAPSTRGEGRVGPQTFLVYSATISAGEMRSQTSHPTHQSSV